MKQPPLTVPDRLAKSHKMLPHEAKLCGHLKLVMTMEQWLPEARENTRDHVISALDEAYVAGMRAVLVWLHTLNPLLHGKLDRDRIWIMLDKKLDELTAGKSQAAAPAAQPHEPTASGEVAP